MESVIGIRREDKNRWERRVPLVPSDVRDLNARHGLHFLVQPSAIRVYSDADYRSAAATVSEDLGPSSIVFAVKEVPIELLMPGKIYIYFAHVVKGQHHNMPMLHRLMELGCTLIDYEKITDDKKRRLIFFGRHAGYAGMIDTLHCLGARFKSGGISNPLAEVRKAHEYPDLAAAKEHLSTLIPKMARGRGNTPLVFGFSGYGNVSTGAQEVFDSLDPVEFPVADLASADKSAGGRPVKVVFREEDMVVRKDAGKPFELLEYYEHPERYEGCFERHLPYLDVLVNCIYWEPRYPRLVTREWARKNYVPGRPPRLKVIGDISCDIEGSVELTVRATEPDNPCYVYLAQEGETSDGVDGNGPVVMAVDNLPCELPKESSQYFSSALRDMVPPLAAADWRSSFDRLSLPDCLKRAVIVYRGELTPSYQYLHKHLEAHP